MTKFTPYRLQIVLAFILALATGSAAGLGADRVLATLGGDVQIKSVSTGKCMDVEGASTQDGARILSWTCHSGWNQIFNDPNNDDIDSFRSWHTNETKCIDVPNGSYELTPLFRTPTL
ncbi:MAG: RICIN domain-containing protein [Dehalococcoidia bacterium]